MDNTTTDPVLRRGRDYSISSKGNNMRREPGVKYLRALGRITPLQ